MPATASAATMILLRLFFVAIRVIVSGTTNGNQKKTGCNHTKSSGTFPLDNGAICGARHCVDSGTLGGRHGSCCHRDLIRTLIRLDKNSDPSEAVVSRLVRMACSPFDGKCRTSTLRLDGSKVLLGHDLDFGGGDALMAEKGGHSTRA